MESTLLTRGPSSPPETPDMPGSADARAPELAAAQARPLAQPGGQNRPGGVVVRQLRDLGFASQSGLHPGLSVHAITPAAVTAAPPAGFLAGDLPPRWVEQLFAPRATAPLRCIAITDGIIAPTGIAISGDTAFYDEPSMLPVHHVRRVTEAWVRPELPLRRIAGRVAVIYGPAHQTWGHWICDILPRLHVLRQSGENLASLRFAVPPDLRGFGAALLARCGIAADQLIRFAYGKELLQAETLLLPSGYRNDDALVPGFGTATRAWLDRAGCPRHGRPGHLKLFLSRAGAGTERVMANRQEIEALAQRRSFRILHPEAMPLDEQLALYAQARAIVGEYGSALHNAVFAPRGTRVLALRGTARHPGLLQSALCAAMGQACGYVLGLTGPDAIEQRFRIDPAQFERGLGWVES